MANSNFVDYVKMYLASGKGGNGAMHLRREKYIPKGGPDGGDGGRGGHIILRGNPQYWTLIHLKYKRHIRAEAGENGSGGFFPTNKFIATIRNCLYCYRIVLFIKTSAYYASPFCHV